MHCPICQAPETKVIDSRLGQEGVTIRRRRQCESCHGRFTTYEKVLVQLPGVKKNDGRIENFKREKIEKGISKACHKRGFSTKQIDDLIDASEKSIIENFDKEIPAEKIGDIVMEHLKKLDHVSYVRFASFYWNYDDIDGFVQELKQCKSDGDLAQGENNE